MYPNPLSPHDALKHNFTSLETYLIFLQLGVLEQKFPCKWFSNTWQFSVIFKPHQIIFIHYKSRIANSGLKGLKPDIYGYNISVVLFSCFKKFKCLGDVLPSVSLPEFAKLRSQLLDVFIISSDFDLAQHFSCSVKTVECGPIFILACWQLQKKAQHNFIGQF